MPDGFYVAASVADAVAALAERGTEGAPLAGATWLMRASLRGETLPAALVAVAGIDDLRRVTATDRTIDIGACVTHAELFAAIRELPYCRVLADAAGHSANPAIREMATVGGNLCASAFAAADLPPALLCLDAEVELVSPRGAERLPLDRFLTRRADLEPGVLLTRIVLRRAARRSAHVRLPLRKAGDYPVAIVSVALTMRADRIETARIAVGSVERVARRWERLEACLVGSPMDAHLAAEHAASLSDEFHGRDDVAAPGWYRRQVLPTLVRRAIQAASA